MSYYQYFVMLKYGIIMENTNKIFDGIIIESLDAYAVFNNPEVASKAKELAKLISKTEEPERVDECIRSILYETNLQYPHGEYLYPISRAFVVDGILQECKNSTINVFIQN